MDNAELIKIVITAVATLVAREFLSWFIKTTRKLATALKNRVIPWITKDPQRFDLVLQFFSCIFFFCFFFSRSTLTSPVTHASVHATVFVGCMFFWELFAFTTKLRRYVDRRKDA